MGGGKLCLKCSIAEHKFIREDVLKYLEKNQKKDLIIFIVTRQLLATLKK